MNLRKNHQSFWSETYRKSRLSDGVTSERGQSTPTPGQVAAQAG